MTQRNLNWREYERETEGVKKAEVLKIPLGLVFIREGFNPRDITKSDTKAKILSMKESYKAGRYVAPLEVVLIGEQTYVVDGHCRRIAAGMANDELINEGHPGIESLICVPFKGNDAAALVHTVSGNEGEKLIPVEVADVVSRLVNMGWERSKIASTFTYSAGWVDKLVYISTMPEKIKQMVKDGKVSTDVAVAACKEHGEAATDYLEGLLAGETEKVTTKKTKSAAEKAKLSGEKFEQEVFDEVRAMVEGLGFDKEDYPIKKLADDEDYEIVIPGPALKRLIVLTELFRKRGIAEEKEKAKAADEAVEDPDMMGEETIQWG